eukprot:8238418-Pyramimonas_sp.AAC.1
MLVYNSRLPGHLLVTLPLLAVHPVALAPRPSPSSVLARACRSLARARAARKTCACKPSTPSGGARAFPSRRRASS